MRQPTFWNGEIPGWETAPFSPLEGESASHCRFGFGFWFDILGEEKEEEEEEEEEEEIQQKDVNGGA